MQRTRRFSLLKSGQLALTIAAAAFLSMPASAAAAPTAKHKQQHSFRMQISSGGQLGAQVTNMSDDLRKFFGAPEGVGLLVDQVMPDTPAAKAGLRSGDVIIRVQGTAIDGAMDIFGAMAAAKKGDKVSIEIIRAKKKKTLYARLDGNSALSMHWGAGRGGIDPFGQGDMKIDFGSNFPFHQGPEAMQKRVRQLEKRLNRLEGVKKSKKKKLKKSERTSGPKS